MTNIVSAICFLFFLLNWPLRDTVIDLYTYCRLEWNFSKDDYPTNLKIKEVDNMSKRVLLDDGKLSFDIYFVNLDNSNIKFYHKNENEEIIKNISNLKSILSTDSLDLLFATNGGMFNPDFTPTGLFIDEGTTEYPLNLKKGGDKFTNFYDLPPNGVFYIEKNGKYGIVESDQFLTIDQVRYATQSAPILVKDGEINERFERKSTSKYIRSGVGITAQKKIMKSYELIFAISNEPISFYDFSRIFKYYGCEQALYLDGAISEMYIHDSNYENRKETFNDFASIISIIEKI